MEKSGGPFSVCVVCFSNSSSSRISCRTIVCLRFQILPQVPDQQYLGISPLASFACQEHLGGVQASSTCISMLESKYWPLGLPQLCQLLERGCSRVCSFLDGKFGVGETSDNHLQNNVSDSLGFGGTRAYRLFPVIKKLCSREKAENKTRRWGEMTQEWANSPRQEQGVCCPLVVGLAVGLGLKDSCSGQLGSIYLPFNKIYQCLNKTFSQSIFPVSKGQLLSQIVMENHQMFQSNI